MVNVAIAGACGRMGQRLGSLSVADDQLHVACALETPGHLALGKDYGVILGGGMVHVAVSETMTTRPDVLIDFSTPVGTRHWVDAAKAHHVAMVIGTTGLGDDDLETIRSAAETIPIVQAPNMSVGVNLLFRIAGDIAKSLGNDYDIEIVEAHHRFKKDAPSGTALGLLQSVCRARGVDPNDVAAFGRQGAESERKPGQIGVHALRTGDTVGEHTVSFGTVGETVTISHTAHSRDTFAAGALRAAKWIAGRSPGLYSMQDVLFADT